eukprot:553252-Rhodomonas_salina.1
MTHSATRHKRKPDGNPTQNCQKRKACSQKAGTVRCNDELQPHWSKAYLFDLVSPNLASAIFCPSSSSERLVGTLNAFCL